MGKVLVVDDDAGITLLLQRIISKRGHQIIIARNGWEGLNRAQSELPDMIFTDVRMPDLSGLELATMLRADPSLEHIPIVILSGTAYLVDLEDTMADAILTKPFDLKAVYGLLDRFLGPHQPSPPSSSKLNNQTPTGGTQSNGASINDSAITDPPTGFSASQS